MIGISSNDAGGAEILSEYVINNKNKYLFFLSGPAVKILKKKISNLKISTFNKSIHKLSLVISSTTCMFSCSSEFSFFSLSLFGLLSCSLLFFSSSFLSF